MKLKCISNFGYHTKIKLVNVTVDKIYSGQLDGVTSVIIFDDSGEWKYYPLHIFIPAEGN